MLPVDGLVEVDVSGCNVMSVMLSCLLVAVAGRAIPDTHGLLGSQQSSLTNLAQSDGELAKH